MELASVGACYVLVLHIGGSNVFIDWGTKCDVVNKTIFRHEIGEFVGPVTRERLLN